MSESETTSTAADLKALKALQADTSKLERIKELLDRSNVFEAIGFIGREVMHSRFLAFLLDPRQNHGLGDLFLRSFLRKCTESADEDSLPQIDHKVGGLGQTTVRTEVFTGDSRIDILLYRIRVYTMRMPKRIELSPHASTQELEHRYKKARDPVQRSHLQIVWLLSEGKRTEEVCEVTGYSPGWVRQIARRYNERGVEGLGDGRHKNPGAKGRALLDEQGQAQLKEALSGAPPASVGGGMWSGPKVARWIEQRNGLKKVHAQRGFEYLRKVGMSPQVLRPSNASGTSPSEREAFKKASR